MTNIATVASPMIEHRLYEQPVYSDWVVTFWYFDEYGNSVQMASKTAYNHCTEVSATASAYLNYVIIRGSVRKSAQRLQY